MKPDLSPCNAVWLSPWSSKWNPGSCRPAPLPWSTGQREVPAPFDKSHPLFLQALPTSILLTGRPLRLILHQLCSTQTHVRGRASSQPVPAQRRTVTTPLDRSSVLDKSEKSWKIRLCLTLINLVKRNLKGFFFLAEVEVFHWFKKSASECFCCSAVKYQLQSNA